MDDLISRKAAIDHLKKRLYETALNNNTEHPYYEEMADNRVSVWLEEVPSVDVHDRKDDAWDVFEIITSVYYGKQYYFLQDDGLVVYSRASHKYMTKDAAIDEFLDAIGQ